MTLPVLVLIAAVLTVAPAFAQGDLAQAPMQLTLQATTGSLGERCRRIETTDSMVAASLHRTFHDDFDTHPLAGDRWVPHYAGGAAWPEAQYWGGDGSDFKRKTAWNGEQQIYVDPRYGGRRPRRWGSTRSVSGMAFSRSSRAGPRPHCKPVLFNNEYIIGHPDDPEQVLAEVRIFRNSLQDTDRDRRVACVLDARR